MAAESMKDVLQGRLAAQRGELVERRGQLRDFTKLPWLPDTFAQAPLVEEKLDAAQQALGTEPPHVTRAGERLKEARALLDEMDRALTVRGKILEVLLAVWGILFLVMSAHWMIFIWTQPFDATSNTYYIHRISLWAPIGGVLDFSWKLALDPDRWSLVRPVLLAAAGGLGGAALQIGRVLYLAIPSRTLNPRSALWYYFSPFFGAALAGTLFAIIRAGFFSMGGGSTPSTTTSATAIAVGILVGFEPTAVFERIKAVIKAFFGTDEVRGPRIAPPQVLVSEGRIRATAAVSSSAATRITAVTAILQSDGFTATLALQRGADYTWSTECPVPTGLEGKKSATVVIEARDEANNVNRSEPIAIALASAQAVPGTTPPAEPGVRSSVPAEGGALPPNDPLVVRFNTPMEDADPALTGPEDASIELAKSWSDGNTVLTLTHAPLAAGQYLLVLENALLPDGTELEPAWQVRFSVASAPTPNA